MELEDQLLPAGSEAFSIPIVGVTGEIDLAVAPSLRERLDLLLSAGSTTIAVDLLGATFLDSVALGVLVGALDRCRQAGGDLYLVVTEPRILKVLEITGLSKTFPIHARIEDLAGLGSQDAAP
jgi:anti-sigma B factor antagonist